MSNHFIKEIEIESFKCFKNFKAEGFGRVNLIGGKNNVGKTALLEGLYINSNSIDNRNFLASLYNIELNREKTNLLSTIINDMRQNNEEDMLKNLFSLDKVVKKKNFLIKKMNIFTDFKLHSNIREVSFKNETDTNYSFILNSGEENTTTLNNFDNLNLSLRYKAIYIENLGIDSDTLISFYDVIQEKDREEELNAYLKEFDKDIEKFKIYSNTKPKIKKNGKYFELTTFGDGLKLYISIVVSLLTIQNGYIYIDEIDNGIHYTKLDKLWEIILTLSKEQNVQVFATTHSKEMIESYYKVAKRLKDEKKLKNEDITFIGLRKLKDNSIASAVRTLELIESSLEDKRELR